MNEIDAHLTIGIITRIKFYKTILEHPCTDIMCKEKARKELTVSLDLFCAFMPSIELEEYADAVRELDWLTQGNAVDVYAKFHALTDEHLTAKAREYSNKPVGPEATSR